MSCKRNRGSVAGSDRSPWYRRRSRVLKEDSDDENSDSQPPPPILSLSSSAAGSTAHQQQHGKEEGESSGSDDILVNAGSAGELTGKLQKLTNCEGQSDGEDSLNSFIEDDEESMGDSESGDSSDGEEHAPSKKMLHQKMLYIMSGELARAIAIVLETGIKTRNNAQETAKNLGLEAEFLLERDISLFKVSLTLAIVGVFELKDDDATRTTLSVQRVAREMQPNLLRGEVLSEHAAQTVAKAITKLSSIDYRRTWLTIKPNMESMGTCTFTKVVDLLYSAIIREYQQIVKIQIADMRDSARVLPRALAKCFHDPVQRSELLAATSSKSNRSCIVHLADILSKFEYSKSDITWSASAICNEKFLGELVLSTLPQDISCHTADYAAYGDGNAAFRDRFCNDRFFDSCQMNAQLRQVVRSVHSICNTDWCQVLREMDDVENAKDTVTYFALSDVFVVCKAHLQPYNITAVIHKVRKDRSLTLFTSNKVQFYWAVYSRLSLFTSQFRSLPINNLPLEVFDMIINIYDEPGIRLAGRHSKLTVPTSANSGIHVLRKKVNGATPSYESQLVPKMEELTNIGANVEMLEEKPTLSVHFTQFKQVDTGVHNDLPDRFSMICICNKDKLSHMHGVRYEMTKALDFTFWLGSTCIHNFGYFAEDKTERDYVNFTDLLGVNQLSISTVYMNRWLHEEKERTKKVAKEAACPVCEDEPYEEATSAVETAHDDRAELLPSAFSLAGGGSSAQLAEQHTVDKGADVAAVAAVSAADEGAHSAAVTVGSIAQWLDENINEKTKAAEATKAAEEIRAAGETVDAEASAAADVNALAEDNNATDACATDDEGESEVSVHVQPLGHSPSFTVIVEGNDTVQFMTERIRDYLKSQNRIRPTMYDVEMMIYSKDKERLLPEQRVLQLQVQAQNTGTGNFAMQVLLDFDLA